MKVKIIIPIIFLLLANLGLAQSPDISYSGVQVSYPLNSSITTLVPVNTGGEISATQISMLSLGSGFGNPHQITIDANGNIYVADYDAVKKMDATGENITIVKSQDYEGIAVDGDGNIYVPESSSIMKMDSTGEFIISIGSGFSHPRNLVFKSGSIFLADNGNGAVKGISPSGDQIYTFATSLNNPTGLAIDNDWNIYVTEILALAGNLKKINTQNGDITTLSTDFNQPSAVSVDGDGNIYVADWGHHAIKKLDANGNLISTIQIGSGFPTSVAVDAEGNIFVGEIQLYNNLFHMTKQTKGNVYAGDEGAYGGIKKFSFHNYTIHPSLPTGLIFNTATGAISGTPTVVTENTDYTIITGNEVGLDSTTISFAIHTVGLEEIADNNFKYYPNPAQDIINIESVYNLNNINLFDISGQVVYSNNNNVSKLHTIDVSSFSEGIYFIELSTDVETRIIKIVIE